MIALIFSMKIDRTDRKDGMSACGIFSTTFNTGYYRQTYNKQKIREMSKRKGYKPDKCDRAFMRMYDIRQNFSNYNFDEQDYQRWLPEQQDRICKKK
jgi:hypothetical protein